MYSLFVRFFVFIIGTLAIAFMLSVMAISEHDFNRDLEAFVKQSNELFFKIEKELSFSELPVNVSLNDLPNIYSHHKLALIERPDFIEDSYFYDRVNGQVIYADTNQNDDLEVYYPIKNTGYVFRITEKLLPVKSDNYDQIMFVFIFLCVGVVIFLLIYRLNMPIRKLTNATKMFGEGNIKTQIEGKMPEPFSTLAQQFNTMAKEIRQGIEEQHIMTHAMSHELRTPLNRLRFALDMARNETDIDRQKELLSDVDQSADELHLLTDNILDFARFSFFHDAKKYSDVSLNDIIVDMVSSKRTVYEHVSIQCQLSDDVVVHGDAFQLQRVFSNLIDNACKYGDSEVIVSLRVDKKWVRVCVDDNGNGIAHSDRQKILMPFSRLDTSRNRSTGGVGLGLAIVQCIVKKHQGTVTVGASDSGGARFELCFPCVSEGRADIK